MIIQDAVNKYKIEIGDDERQTVFGLLAKKQSYQYRFVVSDQSHYFEYEIPGDYLYVMIRSQRQSSQAEIKIADYVRKCLSKSNGYYTEQNIQVDSIYSPGYSPYKAHN